MPGDREQRPLSLTAGRWQGWDPNAHITVMDGGMGRCDKARKATCSRKYLDGGCVGVQWPILSK